MTLIPTRSGGATMTSDLNRRLRPSTWRRPWRAGPKPRMASGYLERWLGDRGPAGLATPGALLAGGWTWKAGSK